jgi:hypothetical protein
MVAVLVGGIPTSLRTVLAVTHWRVVLVAVMVAGARQRQSSQQPQVVVTKLVRRVVL